MFVSSIQTEDIAPRDENLNILYEEFCKVGDVINPQPTVTAKINTVKISKKAHPELTEIGDGKYRITGKIIGGFNHFGHRIGDIYLVIDVGFLIRANVVYPIKHITIKTENGKRYVPLVLTPEDEPETLSIGLGDYITFESVIIKAMWLDLWESTIYVDFKGTVVDRVINKDKSMWITVEPIKIEKKFQLCEYYSKLPLSKILSKDKRILIEYPSKLV